MNRYAKIVSVYVFNDKGLQWLSTICLGEKQSPQSVHG